MPQYIQLPSGAYYEAKEGQSYMEALASAKAKYPEAFEEPERKPAPKTGLGADVASSIANLYNIGRTGLAALTGDTTQAAIEGVKREKAAAERYKPTFSAENVTQPFEQGEYGKAAMEAVKGVPGAIAQLAPSVGQEMGLAAAGRLGGGALGTFFGGPAGAAIGAQVGQYAVPFVVNAIQALGGQAQAKVQAQTEAGEKPDVNALELAPYATANAAANLIGTRIAMPSVFKKAIGQKVEAEAESEVRAKLMAEAEKIAGRGRAKAIGAGIGKFAFGELPTEVFQDVIDRAAVGQSLTDDDAFKQYRSTALMMVLASPLGGGFGLHERAGAQKQVAAEEKRKELEARAAAQQALVQKAKDDAARYAGLETEVGGGTEAATQPYHYEPQQTLPGFGGAIETAAPAQEEEKVDYAEQVRNLTRHIDDLREQSKNTPDLNEKDRLFAQAEQAGAALKAAQERLKAEPKSPDAGIASLITRMRTAEENGDLAEQKQLADKLRERGVTNIAQWEQQQAASKTQLGLGLGPAKPLVAPAVAQEQADKARTQRATQNAQQAAQQRLAELEAQEAEAAKQGVPFEQLAPGVGAEIMALRRIAYGPAGISTQFGLFGKPDQAPAPSAAIGQVQQSLLGEDITATGPAERRFQRGEKAPFALRGRAEGTGAPVTRDALLDRLNRVLTTYDLSPEAVEFLQRVERVLPQAGQDYFDLLDQQLAKIESGEEGVPRKGERRTLDLQAAPAAATRAETAAPTTATDTDIAQRRAATPGQTQSVGQMAQAAAQERRAEGKGGRTAGFVYQPDETERATTETGQVPVYKRVTDFTGSTLRGASAAPRELSLANELNEPLRLQETVAQEGVQRSLFPETEESVKLTRAGFQTYLRSPKVEALRAALRRDKEVLKRAQQLPALEQRAKALIEEIDGILNSVLEYRSADAILQANKDVANARRSISEIRSAAANASINRMMLSGRVQQLQEGRRAIIEEGRSQGETVEPDFLAELDQVTQAMEEAQTDLALLDSAMSTLDGQMQSFAALQRMTGLVEKGVDLDRIPAAQKELTAVRTEIDKLREDYNEVSQRLQKEAADKRRAEEAVREQERKDQVEAGRVKPNETLLENLPGISKVTQYPALSEAQRLAREHGGKLPELTDAEKKQLEGNPYQTLGGFRSRITVIEKRIRQAQDSAKKALATEIVGPKQQAFDDIDARYKAAKSSAERAALGTRLDIAQRQLQRAKAQVASTDVTWVGMKKDIAELANAMRKADWLEGMISEGRVEELHPRQAKVVRDTSAALRAQERQREVSAAQSRAGAPATSGEALTRTEAKKAAAPKKTTFEGKGVPGGTAKEIPLTPAERLADMQAKAKERAQRGLLRTSTAGAGTDVDTVRSTADEAVAGWNKAPKIETVQSENELPTRLHQQIIEGEKEGQVPGLYDPETKTVWLIADNLRNVNDVALTIAHEVAGHHGLREMLGATYSNIMRSTYEGNKAVREAADAKMAADPSLSRDVATEEVLADMAETGPYANSKMTNALRRVIYAVKQWLQTKMGVTHVTDSEVRQLVADARRYVKQGKGGRGGAAPVTKAVQRTHTDTPTLDKLAKDVIQQPKSWREKLGVNPALEAEMQGVDMRAGLREALKTGDAGSYEQAMYHVLKSDQRLPQVYNVLNNGPLETYVDERGLHGIRSTGKNSGREVFEAISDVPKATAQEKADTAQMYLTAHRALNKGVSKLDIGKLGVTEEGLRAVLAEVDADPKLKAALENVRKKYNAYNEGLIRFAVQAGRISKEQADALLKEGDYVPFYRVRSDGTAELVYGDGMTISIGDIKNQPYLQELKGGEEKLLPLTESLFRNTLLLTDASLSNMARKSVAYAFQEIGKEAGEIDPLTGKAKNKMAIHSGHGPAKPTVIRFYSEPNPKDPNDDGRRWIDIDTEGTVAEGVPAALVVKSMEGAHLPLPAFLKAAGMFSDAIRSGVTRMPPYMIRQLIRDPMVAAFTGGLNYGPLRAVVKAGKEFIAQARGKSDTAQKLLEKGLIQSGIFTGDVDDMSKMALQLVSGKDMNVWNKMMGALDRYAIMADASTRALVYENALKNGLSEVQADIMTMESMNFYKRGLNPAVQYGNRLIPFINSQIQGLNVLYKAARGKMPYNEQQQIKQKFFNNAMYLMAMGFVYAMAMDDDDYYKNAKPRDKYSNFFLHLPGVDEPVKIPVPYEAGYFFSVPVAIVDMLKNDRYTPEQWQAVRDLFLNSIPGWSSRGVPQIAKPALEVWTNKNFLTGAPIESLRLQNMDITERANANTTEFAKQLSKALPLLSPVQIEHLAHGYLGIAPLLAFSAAGQLFGSADKGETPTMRASEAPVFGSMFQRKFGGADADEVFRLAKEAEQARTTFNRMRKEGRPQDAIEYRDEHRVELATAQAAGQYRQLVGRLNLDAERVRNRNDMTADEKRERLDKLDKAKQDAADRFLTHVTKLEERLQR